MDRLRFPVALLKNDRGQSTVEYLVVASALMAALIAAPSVSDRLVQTMHNKYESYAFSVAISDPPRKAADDQVHEITEQVREWTDVLGEGQLPDDIDPDNPFSPAIEWFLKKLEGFF